MSMAAVKPALVGANKSAFKGTRVSAVAPKKVAGGRATLQVRTPAMRPPAPAPATDASLETIARARARPRAPLDRIARASPASSSRRPRARAAAPDRATRRKREPSHRSRVQRVACGEDMPPDRRAREPRRARDSVGAHRDARRARRGVRRARLTPVPARATRRTSALRARSARIHRPFIHSLPFGDALALGPGPVEPWFLESRAGSAKKRKTFRVCGVFFFLRATRRQRARPFD